MAGLIILVALAAWEWGGRLGLIPVLYFPTPTFIGQTFLKQMDTGALPRHISLTLGRLAMGLVLGGVSGLLLGLVMGSSQKLRVVVDPLIAAAHPIPKIAVLPLIMVIFGIGETPTVIVASMGAFFPLVINTMAGVRQIHPIHFDVAKNFGATPLKVFTRVVWPGSKPMMFTGLRLALNTTLLLTVAVEMVSAHQGLGATIWMAWTTMRIEEIYVSLALITLMGIAFNVLLHYLTLWVIPWQADQAA